MHSLLGSLILNHAMRFTCGQKGDTNLLHVADIVPLCLLTLLIKVLAFSH